MEPSQEVARLMTLGFVSTTVAELEPCPPDVGLYLLDFLRFMVTGKGREKLMESCPPVKIEYNLVDLVGVNDALKQLGFEVRHGSETRAMQVACAARRKIKDENRTFYRLILAIATSAGSQVPAPVDRALANNVVRQVSLMFLNHHKEKRLLLGWFHVLCGFVCMALSIDYICPVEQFDDCQFKASFERVQARVLLLWGLALVFVLTGESMLFHGYSFVPPDTQIPEALRCEE
jgi:hypothetical protein